MIHCACIIGTINPGLSQLRLAQYPGAVWRLYIKLGRDFHSFTTCQVSIRVQGGDFFILAIFGMMLLGLNHSQSYT